MVKEFVEQLEKLVENATNIVIVGHFNPDGDSVGSVTGMRSYLEMKGKNPKVLLPSKYPDFLSFLDADSDYQVYTQNPELVTESVGSADLILCLDFNNLGRTEGLKELISSSSATKVLIDHHPSPEVESFDLVCSTVKTSSTCELLFYVLMETTSISNDVQKMPYKCAEALATGMLTDTNNFKNSAIASTYKMASLLLERGVSLDDLGKRVFGSYSESRMRLMGEMLRNQMVVLPELGAAYMVLSKKIQKEYNYLQGDSEGFVNLPLLIEGVEVSAMFTESDEFIRVSLRSQGGVSVNALSRSYFNGGGHERASGGRLFIPVEEVPEYFEKSLKAFLAERE
ncbi:MAG: bifunctional oligoribonuclease/PAP phosphatase NrnA [Bacteroidales bacterium]|nr:bifunctional oligoribonuclease/PAP phosphatase NrnA [Bacteroidales bacterium]